MRRNNHQVQSKSSKTKKLASKSKRKGKGKQEDQHVENSSTKLMEKAKLLSQSTEQQVQILKDLHNKIILNPEEEVKHLESMFALVKVPNLKIVCIALRVLAETFVNICPLEAIQVKKLEERAQVKIKKEEYKVVKFEKILVEQYERFIKMLKEMNSKAKLANFQNDQEVYSEFKKCLLQCLIKCYRSLWNFNYAKQLNELTLKFLKYQACRNFIQEMLTDKNIAMIGIKVKIINGIAKLIKEEENEKRLPEDLVKILNSTYIDTRYLKKDQETLVYKKKLLKKKLYRQEALENKKEKEKLKNAERGTLQMKKKKKQEKMKEKLRVKEEINKQFAEGEAIVNNRELVRHNSNILQELFYIYFKILVERISSVYLRDCLDGILKFVHLINIQLTQSLLEHINVSASVFREYWKATPTSSLLETRLLIVFTGESIINGPLSVYSMDDAKMTTHLYKIMKDINRSHKSILNKSKNKSEEVCQVSKEVYRMICLNIEEAFLKRRQLSQQIVGSLMRELAIFIQRPQIPKLCILQILALLAFKYNKVSRMFEADNEGFGMNSFNPSSEDPQCSNAINTELLTYLKTIAETIKNLPKQYQQIIGSKVQKLCSQNFQPKDKAVEVESIIKDEIEGKLFFHNC